MENGHAGYVACRNDPCLDERIGGRCAKIPPVSIQNGHNDTSGASPGSFRAVNDDDQRTGRIRRRPKGHEGFLREVEGLDFEME